ncbi:hypothetical protein V866_003370 [Kwoniella sp. B9012]|uniref:Cell wall protein n=1 Tax=Kwoniella europaea PYCC6329 TaxID=1423913 RepID=A0AAX4KFC0_9TREE
MRSINFITLLPIFATLLSVNASVVPTPRPAKRQGDLIGDLIDSGIAGATDLLGDATSGLDGIINDVTSAARQGVTDATSLFGVVTSKVAEEFTEHTSIFGEITSKLDSAVDQIPITKIESWASSVTAEVGSKVSAVGASVTGSSHVSPTPTPLPSATSSVSQVPLNNNNNNSDSAGYILGVNDKLIVLAFGAVLTAVAL